MPRIAVAKIGDIAEGSGIQVDVDDKNIAVFLVGENYYAIENNCTHLDVPLHEGETEGTHVVCPLHGAKFDLETGEALCPPAGASVDTYSVHVEGDEIQLEVS
ncbi:MAG: non-heme iron oxygenase ferredoxin subunit [Planctomycetota bacterium]|jgi:3-phenylpropionate/trans-cinnamate dioxygenase ferredoxin subunit|nr:non-heme iron oxygenase ferredoxin subunit [Planctomycetota bacterium]